MIYKVFGPPGTGKTTYLLNVVNDCLARGVAPERIGYFAFTKKAANEAKERAFDKFPHLNKVHLANFRTLHSLAYARMGVTANQMAKPGDYEKFQQLTGIALSVESGEEGFVVKASNPVLDTINLARVRDIDIKVEYNRSKLGISWHHFLYIYETYRKFMQDNSLLDFTDLLELFANANDEYYPMLDVVIIDEAQDLSPLQWKIVDRLVKRAKDSYLAGDDDQAIYNFSGADVTKFLQYEVEQIVLDQSYRVPRAIHEYCNQVVKRIKYRVDKVWRPNDNDGSLSFHGRVIDIDFTQPGTWLILSSTNYLLNDIHEHLKSLGLLFQRNHVRSIAESTVNAVYCWELLRKDQSISAHDVKDIYKLMSVGRIAHGKKKFEGLEDVLYNYEELSTNHGLRCSKDTPWFEALDKIPADKEIYIRAALRRGQSLRGNPRITLSTIHGAKGGEADNVVLLTDLSTKFMDEYYASPDNINRLLYVGVTRTKNNLHLVYPKDQRKAFVV